MVSRMPTAHIDAEGTVTLTDPGTAEDASRAEEGLQRLIVELTKMAVTRLSAAGAGSPREAVD